LTFIQNGRVLRLSAHAMKRRSVRYPAAAMNPALRTVPGIIRRHGAPIGPCWRSWSPQAGHLADRGYADPPG